VIPGGSTSTEKASPRAWIDTVPSLVVHDRVLVAHGHAFDHVMPHHRVFIALFKLLHAVRILCGARAEHVAEYAKRWRLLYNHLRRHVRHNAATHAKTRALEAATCGHVHYAEQCKVDGIRYFNTGTWTESPTFCLLVDGNGERLVDVAELTQTDDWFPATRR